MSATDDLHLEVYEGVGQLRRVDLPDGAALVVGRMKTCDVVLVASGVSRQHCKLTRAGDVVEVENLSTSKGGTQV
ncbi:MAG: FHA domain-containing protein, partial [Planctomycetota bacterium]|nr:FHA domain-containing protein [Planctomycetota bacterium]